MSTVVLSSRNQILIPRGVRKELGIEAGQRMLVVVLDGRMEVVPIRSVESMRGFLNGMDTLVEREPDRVLDICGASSSA